MKRIIYVASVALVCFFSLSGCAMTVATHSSSDCIRTKPISEVDFIKTAEDKDLIIPLEIRCEEGFFISGIKLQPEENPLVNGQYIIISEIICCPCNP